MRAIEDSYFNLPEVPPFAPGTSPFRIKGWGYTGDQRFYSDFVPGGIDAIAHNLNDPGIATFLHKSFRPDDWYDVVPKLYLGAAASRVRGMTHEAHAREVSRFHAVEKFSGIYRPLLKILRSEVIAIWCPRLASTFYDFGTTESHVAGPRHVCVDRRGIPRIAVQWWSWAASAYFEYVLEAAGARAPHVKWLGTEADGERMGMELFRMPFEISWS